MSTGASTEETPLLGSPGEDVYSRFSEPKKRALVALVSCCALMPLLISGTFIPSIPQIAEDLQTSPSTITLAVSLSIFGTCIGSLFAAAYSTFYGRRPIYLVGLPLLCLGSICVALSDSVHMLIISRFIQAFGASPGMSVGAAVIGDIYKLEQRGSAMGIFLGASLLGPAIAPLVGGIAAAYASWRSLQLHLGVLGGLSIFIPMFLFFPETSHPGARGIDKRPPNSSKIVFVNPVKPLFLLRSPNLLAVSMAGFHMLLTDYVLLVPIAFTLGKSYKITNPAIIGACFLPNGIGNILGAPLGGSISDRIITRWRSKRKGLWYPEDRLRVTLPAASLIPLSVVFCGLAMEYVPGPVGLSLCLVCLFLNGLGLNMVLGPSAAYVVDILRDQSAEGVAAVNGLRAFLLSFAVSGILPLVETFGILWTNAFIALVAWLGYLMLWITVRYGSRMRSWVDVGYSVEGSEVH